MPLGQEYSQYEKAIAEAIYQVLKDRGVILSDNTVGTTGGGGGGGGTSQATIQAAIDASTDIGAIVTSLANIDTDATTLIGHVDGIEGHIDGIEGSLSAIDGKLPASIGSRLPVNPWLGTTLSRQTGTNTYSYSAVPSSRTWHVYSLRVDYTSSATAGTRQIVVEWLDGSSNIIAAFRAGTTQAASLTRIYQGGIGLPDMTAFRDTDFLSFPIPAGWELPAGHVLRVRDNKNIHTGDSFTVSLVYKEFVVA